MLRVETPVIETVVMQPTPFCNIECTLLLSARRAATKSVMHQDTVRRCSSSVFASGWVAPRPHRDLACRGAAGPAGRRIIETRSQPIERMRPADIAIASRHPDQRHADHRRSGAILPRQWHVGVGVSIDGPRHLHDAHRVTRAGKGTFDRTHRRDPPAAATNGVPFHVISVLSEDSLDAPEELLRFLPRRGHRGRLLQRRGIRGRPRLRACSLPRDPQSRFRTFPRSLLAARPARAGGFDFIREIDGMLPRIFRPEEARDAATTQVEPFGMLNVDCHGNVSSFSPELLGLKNAALRRFHHRQRPPATTLERHARERRDATP